jgi:hypothetical protein
MSHRAQFALSLAGLLLVGLSSLSLLGQGNIQDSQTGPGQTARTPLQINITGCLKKNAEGGYYISDANGRTWELSSKKVDFAKHVFHVVSVSGHPASASNMSQGKSAAPQKPEGDNQHLSLDVVELTTISNSCTR